MGVWYLTSTTSLARSIEKLWIKEVGLNRKPFFYWSLLDEVIEKPQTAVFHSGQNSNQLLKLWKVQEPLKIAQSPAHTQS
jgi:hypothetical protein